MSPLISVSVSLHQGNSVLVIEDNRNDDRITVSPAVEVRLKCISDCVLDLAEGSLLDHYLS